MSKKCVWVLELFCYSATGRSGTWEMWEAFSTRAEALAERNNRSKTVKWRIVKYVPVEGK